MIMNEENFDFAKDVIFNEDRNKDDLFVLVQQGFLTKSQALLILENKTPQEVRTIIGTIQQSAENIRKLGNIQRFRTDVKTLIPDLPIVDVTDLVKSYGSKRWQG